MLQVYVHTCVRRDIPKTLAASVLMTQLLLSLNLSGLFFLPCRSFTNLSRVSRRERRKSSLKRQRLLTQAKVEGRRTDRGRVQVSQLAGNELLIKKCQRSAADGKERECFLPPWIRREGLSRYPLDSYYPDIASCLLGGTLEPLCLLSLHALRVYNFGPIKHHP